MTRPHVLWRLDDPKVHDLEQAPLLASWDAKDSPGQLALQRYLDDIESRIGEGGNASALHLVVCDEGAEAGRGGRDLDNYLYPVVHRLGPNRFDLARATKTADSVNRLIVGQSCQAGDAVAAGHWEFVSATTTASSDSHLWKQQIHEQIAAATHSTPAIPRPVAMELAFRVGPSRTWANLWKPALDSLGPILGEGHRPFAPRDDTIVDMGLHREIVNDLGHRVELGIWWRNAAE